MQKKISKVLFMLLLALSIGTTCTHVHNNECGYDPKTNTGCTHICDYDVSLMDEGRPGGN